MLFLRLLIVISFVSPVWAYGAALSSETDALAIGSSMKYFCTPEDLSVDQLPLNQFKSLDKPDLQLGFKLDYCWLYGTLENQEATDNNFYIDLSFPLLHSVLMYERDVVTGSVNEYRSGFLVQGKSKQVNSADIAFLLGLDAFEKKEIFFRIRTESFVYAKPVVSAINKHVSSGFIGTLVLGLFYGTCVGIFIHSIAVFLSVRRASNIFYTFYVGAVIYINASLDGMTNFIWSDSLALKAMWMNAISSFGLLSITLFARYHLLLERYRLHYFVNNLCIVGSLLMLLVAVTFQPIIFAVVSSVFAPLVIFAPIAAAIKPAQGGDLFSRFFILSWMFPIAASIVISLAGVTDAINAGLAMESFKVGFLLQLVCLSLGIYYQMNLEIREKDMAKLEASRMKEASEEKSRFFAQMSHEIRTPLNGLLGILQLFDPKNMDEQTREYVEVMKSSGNNLQAIVDDILDLSKIESGHLSLEYIDIDLHKMMSNIAKSFEPIAHAGSLKLNCSYEDAPRYINTDPTRLSQVLNNIISNSLKFTPEGEVNISVSEKGRDGDRLQLLFDVTDTGIGVSQEAQADLFNEYRQAELRTAREHGGTGLGLSICKKLVNRMQGDIGVYSEVGKGSHFWFTIEATIASGENIEDSAEEEFDGDGIRDQRILIADDNNVNRLVLKKHMQAWTAYVDEANNGSQTVEAYIKHNGDYQLILLDWDMPIMSGLEVAQHVRAYEKEHGLSPVKIIACTGHVSPQMRQICLDNGMDAYLAKPISRQLLQSTLQSLFG